MATLKVTVKEKTSKGKTTLQGSYQLPGSSVTKLQRNDGTTQFETRATLNQTARRVATALGWELQYEEPAVKAAAKKSTKPTAKKVTVRKSKTSADTSTASDTTKSS